MVIIVIIIGALVMNYALVKIYGHLWGKNLDAQVEFQKEPSLEGRDAMLTETIYNRKWLFLPVLQVGFQMHRNLWFADGKIPVFRISVIKEISFLSADIRKSREPFRFTVPSVGIMSCLR